MLKGKKKLYLLKFSILAYAGEQGKLVGLFGSLPGGSKKPNTPKQPFRQNVHQSTPPSIIIETPQPPIRLSHDFVSASLKFSISNKLIYKCVLKNFEKKIVLE